MATEPFHPRTCSFAITLSGLLFDRYLYAGLQNQAECWCGNQYGRVAETDGSPCLVCRGEYDSLCGRSYKNSVYRTETARLEQGRSVYVAGHSFERHLFNGVITLNVSGTETGTGTWPILCGNLSHWLYL